MSLRTLLVLALAIVCGGSAAVGVVLMWGQSKENTVQVVVCKSDIQRGQLINESMVTTRLWPPDIVPITASRNIDAVVGRTALAQMMAGEPLISAKLADRGAGHGLAALIPEGRRAYTIQTSRVASNVAGFVLPGNRVDVLLTLRGGPNDSTGGGSSTTLLQAVEILAVDRRLDPSPENENDPRHLRSVTLLVTPDQATLLDLGQNTGTLTLSLRNVEDVAEADTTPATVNVLRFTQRQPTETQAESRYSSWLNRSLGWFAAAALTTKVAGADSNNKSEFVTIQTIQGRHSGRLLFRTNSRAASRRKAQSSP